jgi:hypothetical protein
VAPNPKKTFLQKLKKKIFSQIFDVITFISIVLVAAVKKNFKQN